VVQSLFSSLRGRLVLLVAIAMLPAFGLILWTSLEQRRDERHDAEDIAVRLTQAVSAQQEQVVQSAHDVAARLAVSPEVLGTDRAACSAFLADFVSVEGRYTGISVTDPDGNIVCSSVDLGGPVSVADRGYFQQMLQTREFTVSGYLIAKVVGTPTMAFALPIADDSGVMSEAVIGGVDVGWLNDFAERLELPEDTALLVIDGSGTVLTRQPDPEAWVGRAVADTQLGETVLAQGTGTAEMEGLDGTQRLFAFAPLGGEGGSDTYVVVGLSAASAFAGINETLTRNLALLGVVTLLAVAAAWFLGDALVVRKVRLVAAAAQRVSAGDLGARTGLSGEGDLDRLGRGFDAMAGTLEVREAEWQRAQEELARRAEDLARSNAELEQFAYVASHDLQEPLRMVASYTQLLARRYNGQLDSEAHEFIEYAVDGASRMQELINDLLTLSRVGTRGAEPEPTEAEEALAAALRNLELASEESGAEVTHDPLPPVLADQTQLTQLFQNLIGNAIKFRGADLPRIHVSARRDGGDVRFSVKDNGIGIEPQYADRVFVLFQRLHGRGEYPGTGIGLAICKKIVERHGGRIWVEPEPGEGATFSFTLHAAAAPARVAA